MHAIDPSFLLSCVQLSVITSKLPIFKTAFALAVHLLLLVVLICVCFDMEGRGRGEFLREGFEESQNRKSLKVVSEGSGAS